MLRFSGEIRDPVHGLIPITTLEREVINTRVFQRLRSIKQLAMAYLGFPGALHTRFEHSLGVMHVAWRIVEHLKSREGEEIRDNELQNIRLAGLLHDIGHGPFSHVSEYVLKAYYDGSGKIEELHEEVSRRIIRENEQLVGVLGKKRAHKVAELLETDGISGGDLIHDVVSGPLDADKMDYLLRDSYFSGVKYGVFDIDRLINVLTVVPESGAHRLAVKEEGKETAEQYVMAKYFIAQQVYQHKTRLITDLMIIEGMIAAIDNGLSDILRCAYTFKKTKKFLEAYVSLTDARVFGEVQEHYGKQNICRVCTEFCVSDRFTLFISFPRT